MAAPRGIRLNNPGNLQRNATSWVGMSTMQDDPRFIRFDKPGDGLRALMKTALTYYHKHGLDTVESIVNRWAPPVENKTDSYAYSVALHMGVKRREVIDLTERNTLIALAEAITIHENGHPAKGERIPKYWYDDSIYAEAATSALT